MSNQSRVGDASPFIADLESRRDEIRARIKMLEREANEIDAAIALLSRVYGEDRTTVIVPGRFKGKTLAEAAEECLSILGTETQNSDLWNAIARGGIETSSKNPVNNMNSILKSKPETFMRGPSGGWMLADWERESDMNLEESRLFDR